jgi:hypothetical protein
MLLRLLIFAVLMLDGLSRFQPAVYNCSLLELNHRYDDTGRHCYSQIIVWEWNRKDNRHDVEAWWLVEPSAIEKLPKRSGDRWQVYYRDGNGREFRVMASIFRETRTTSDPERDNKLLKPESERRGIR